jgi:hypothetical protein
MRITTVITIAALTVVALTYGSAAANSSRPSDVAIGVKTELSVNASISTANSAADRIELAQYYSNRCFTPYFWCLLPGPVPVGAACWCATPNGPIGGVVR